MDFIVALMAVAYAVIGICFWHFKDDNEIALISAVSSLSLIVTSFTL